MSEQRLKIAVVELGPRHDEVFPAWLHLAKKHGHIIEFFVAPVHRARDIFFVLDSPRPRCYLTAPQRSGRSAGSTIVNGILTVLLRLRALLMLNTKYDIVIANTVDIDNSYQSFLRYIKRPMLAVIHNGYAMVGNAKFGNVRDNREQSIIVLSKHIQGFLAQHHIDSFTIHPDPGPISGSVTAISPDDATFCVQGYINFFRRNYDSLLKAAVKLKEKNVPCRFKIVGRLGRCSRTMQKRIEDLGVTEYFTFVGNAESYQDYYREISACRFLLVLVDDSQMIYRPFFEDKCTSSLGVILGLGLIPVANSKLAEVYDIADFSVTYDADDVFHGIESALSRSSAEIDTLTTALDSTRRRFAECSSLEFERAMDSALGR